MASIIVLVAVHLAAFLFFAINYLRFDVGLKDSASVFESAANEAISHLEKSGPNSELLFQPTFDRFVFVLLDAWRWDFLFSPSTPMNFLKEKLMKGEALGAVSLARIPTVTKPCLKSIFSGSLPVFFEIVENVDESGISASVKTIQDNLLARLHSKGKKICLYGDDVWSKLFPMSMFHRSKVDYGLNIMDYTHVDNMVKEGFQQEKVYADSDILLFHFLGLDHIGHAFYAQKDLIDSKLMEMDSFVSDLQSWVAEDDAKSGRKTLTLVMGDHGMTFDGNHGGGSVEETRAAAVFLSPDLKTNAQFQDWQSALSHFSSKFIHQEDIAATLTVLLDSDKPLANGYGKLIDDAISAFGCSESLLRSNLIHLLRYPFKDNIPLVQNVLHEIIEAPEISAEHLSKWSHDLKQAINSTGFAYDDKKLIISISIMALTLLCGLYICLSSVKMIPGVKLIELVLLLLLCLAESTTSYIAEEQAIYQFVFYILFIAWFAHSFSKLRSTDNVKSGVAVLVIHRVSMSWSSVGTLWRSSWSISDLIKSNGWLQIASVCVALALINFKVIKDFRAKSYSSIASIVVANLSTILNKSKLSGNDSIMCAQICLLSVLYLMIAERNFKVLAYLFVVLNRPCHAMMIALAVIMFDELGKLRKSAKDPLPSLMLMAIAANTFYALGIWNSISAVDLTFGAAFTPSFDMRIAPIVLALYFFSGPILSSSFNILQIDPILLSMRIILDFFACHFAFLHRYHPWIFDFFAPKILFQLLWSTFYVCGYIITSAKKPQNNLLK